MGSTQPPKHQFIQTVLIIPSGSPVPNATPTFTLPVLLLVHSKLKTRSTVREVLFALSWGVERYTFNRYNFNRYKTFVFRKMVKTKHSDKQRPRRKHSPKSSHKGDDIGDYTQKDLDYARDLWEKTKDLPKGQGHLTLRQISEASGVKLGTLNKRMTGKLPWMRNIGGKRTPRVLTRGNVSNRYTVSVEKNRISCAVSVDVWGGDTNLMSHCNLIGEEKDLANTCMLFARGGFPLTETQLRKLAFQLGQANRRYGFSPTKKIAGRKWLRGFLTETLSSIRKWHLICHYTEPSVLTLLRLKNGLISMKTGWTSGT